MIHKYPYIRLMSEEGSLCRISAQLKSCFSNYFCLRYLMIIFLCLFPALHSFSEEAGQEVEKRTQVKKPIQIRPVPKGSAKVETKPVISLENLERPSLIIQGGALVFMSLLPFIIMILTSFIKIVIVLSLLRSALGVQQAPPNQIINGIAFLLSLYVMFPTGLRMYTAAKDLIDSPNVPKDLLSADSAEFIIAVANRAKEPFRDFLKNNSIVKHQKQFFKIVYRVLPDEFRDDLKPDDFLILVPAFITSQLKVAFEIGVLVYIPFFVIDLVVSNILLAMGMMMLSPVTISMPLKLFLLVMLDGWTLLIEGLVSTFR